MSIKLGSSLLAGNLDKNMYPSKDEMNELFSSSVKLDGDQEINGIKTFNNNLYAPNQLDYSKITNCITEIPQDIKLELVDGTLTLKAGSKVYVPNGFETDGVTPKFDVITTTKDLQTTTVTNEKTFIFVKKDGSGLDVLAVANCESGASPTPTTYSVKYDTMTNLCKLYTTNLTVQDRNVSFSIAISQGSSSGFTSIDQVFNGFGYIGSTVFALPGVKGLIPNGRNADGMLRNIELEVSKVITRTTNNSYNTKPIMIYTTGNIQETNDPIIYSEYLPKEGPTYERCYVSSENQWYSHTAESSWKKEYFVIYGDCSRNTGTITSFNPKTTFQAVDRNELKEISNPIGSIIAFAANSTPNGYLICNGAAVSRTTYAYLFEVIGTTYGSGNGSTTFNVPNLTDKFIQGSNTAGTNKNAGLPNITGTFEFDAWSDASTGVFSDAGGDKRAGSNTDNNSKGSIKSFNASRSSSIYGNSSTVQPPALTMRYYIKY